MEKFLSKITIICTTAIVITELIILKTGWSVLLFLVVYDSQK